MSRGAFAVGHEKAVRDALWFASEQVDAGDSYLADWEYNDRVPILLVTKNLSGTAEKRSILRSISFEQVGVIADANIRGAILFDPTYRYESGGVELTPVSPRPGWDSAVSGTLTPEAHVYLGSCAGGAAYPPEIVASAPDAEARVLKTFGFTEATGNYVTIDLGGEAWINEVGSILIYLYMDDVATVTAEVRINLDFVEEILPS